MESRIVQIKLCKENHRVRSRILKLAFSMEFLFKTKLGRFITRSCALRHIAICPNIFWTYNDVRFIVERFPHSHIQRYFCHKHDTLIVLMYKHFQIQSNLYSWFSLFKSRYRENVEIIIFITSKRESLRQSLTQFFRVSIKSLNLQFISENVH